MQKTGAAGGRFRGPGPCRSEVVGAYVLSRGMSTSKLPPYVYLGNVHLGLQVVRVVGTDHDGRAGQRVAGVQHPADTDPAAPAVRQLAIERCEWTRHDHPLLC